MEIKSFLYGFKSLVCTQMTCQNQVNVLAVFFDLPSTLPMMNMLLSANQRCSFYGFFQRLVILGADQKDRSFCERDWEQSVTGSNGLSSSVILVFQRTTVKNSLSKSIAQQARFTVEIETENSLC